MTIRTGDIGYAFRFLSGNVDAVESNFGYVSSICRAFAGGREHERYVRSFGISRKTGYKILDRYKDDGLEALTERSRRPVRHANQLPEPQHPATADAFRRFHERIQ